MNGEERAPVERSRRSSWLAVSIAVSALGCASSRAPTPTSSNAIELPDRPVERDVDSKVSEAAPALGRKLSDCAVRAIELAESEHPLRQGRAPGFGVRFETLEFDSRAREAVRATDPNAVVVVIRAFDLWDCGIVAKLSDVRFVDDAVIVEAERSALGDWIDIAFAFELGDAPTAAIVIGTPERGLKTSVQRIPTRSIPIALGPFVPGLGSSGASGSMSPGDELPTVVSIWSWNGPYTDTFARSKWTERVGHVGSFYTVRSQNKLDDRLEHVPLEKWDAPVWFATLEATRRPAK